MAGVCLTSFGLDKPEHMEATQCKHEGGNDTIIIHLGSLVNPNDHCGFSTLNLVAVMKNVCFFHHGGPNSQP